MNRAFFLFFLFCFCLGMTAKNNDYDVYLLIGQSNMAGRGKMIAEDTTMVIPGVFLLNSEGKVEKAQSPLNRYSNIRKELSMQQIGPGVGFGERMHKLTGRKILLVVNAKGGSSIKEWEPGIEGSFTEASLQRTKQALRYGELKGILWHQGETDADMSTREYAERFNKMISAIRVSLGTTDVPVVVGELGQWGWRSSAQIETFNNATIDAVISGTSNVHKVHSDDLGRLFPDNESDPHFGRDAQIELGHRYAEAMLPLSYDAFISAYKGDKKAGVSFTYDDGMLCHYTDVAPQLEKRGFRGTFWIIGANMGVEEPDYPWMTWSQVKEMSDRGHEMSNHSWTHPNLTTLEKDELVREIFKCDSAIESVTGKLPRTFCYPYNAVNSYVEKFASANRVGTRMFQDAHGQDVSKCTKEGLSEWLKKTIDKGCWSVTMTHGTTYGYDKWEDSEVLWGLYDEVKSHESEVWVGTFSEVAAYREERLRTTLSVRKKGQSWRVSSIMNLDERLFSEDLTLRINGDFVGKNIVARQGQKTLKVVNNGSYILVDFNPSGRLIKISTK